ncbi:MAG: hypothetical protein ACREE4_22490 [Stellaceae bacterium]
MALLPGVPSAREAGRVDAMVTFEWQALKAEALGTIRSDREAREFRRLLDRLLRDFELSVGAPRLSTDEILAALRGEARQ